VGTKVPNHFLYHGIPYSTLLPSPIFHISHRQLLDMTAAVVKELNGSSWFVSTETSNSRCSLMSNTLPNQHHNHIQFFMCHFPLLLSQLYKVDIVPFESCLPFPVHGAEVTQHLNCHYLHYWGLLLAQLLVNSKLIQ
jgi:hypothetical protein